MIAVIADTHMPKGKRRLPEACVEKIRAADALIHAGDFSASSVLAELRGLCPTVLAVHGNVDDAELRGELPEALEVEIGGRTAARPSAAAPPAPRWGSSTPPPPGCASNTSGSGRKTATANPKQGGRRWPS